MKNNIVSVWFVLTFVAALNTQAVNNNKFTTSKLFGGKSVSCDTSKVALDESVFRGEARDEVRDEVRDEARDEARANLEITK